MDDSRASDFGLMKIDGKGRINHFSEKPKGKDLQSMQVDTTVLGLSAEEAQKKPYIASMGIYVFKKSVLAKLLRWRYPLANDFGSEIIPKAAKEFNVNAYLFNDYWEDIGTIKSFFDANLALAAENPNFSFYDAEKPIYTSARYLPPTKIEKCRVKDSIVSHGCFLRECSVEDSVIGIRSRLEAGCDVKRAMVMGADSYETDPEAAALLAEGKVPLGVGENSKLRNCIVDKNARIGKDVVIANTDVSAHSRFSPPTLPDLQSSYLSAIWAELELILVFREHAQNVLEAERQSEGFYIRSGIVVVYKNAVIKHGTVI